MKNQSIKSVVKDIITGKRKINSSSKISVRWIDIRRKQPQHGQNIFFVVNNPNGNFSQIGYFMKPNNDQKKNGLIGICNAKEVHYHVWKKNEYEVTHWANIDMPKIN